MKSKCCAFSTSTDNYIPPALTSLLSFKKYNEEYDMFILCTYPSDVNKELCERKGVTVVEIDLKDTFYKQWDYPKECYYHFKAPELFNDMGYDYSVYIDGDTYCNQRFDFDKSDAFHIAGSCYDTIKEFFTAIGEYEKLQERFGITDESWFEKRRINSGVIIYNNKRLSEISFFHKVGDLFDKCIKKEVPRKGDDSLLALVIALYPEITSKPLSIYYNFIDFKALEMAGGFDEEEIFVDCIIYHFGKQKPWIHLSDYYNYPHKFFVQKWLEVMINNFSQDDIRRCYPQIYKDDLIESEEVGFFWYSVPPPNFGDWITPYLITRTCNIELKNPVDPRQTDKIVILSTGSIMRLCGSNTIVWGSGIRDRNQDIKPGKLIRSVRGPLTRKRILEVGGECPPIYGDPALLLPRFYRPKNIRKRFQLGVIPHISQYYKVRQLYENDEGVVVIDVRTKDIEMVVDQVLECAKIVSSSLHGIIVANAYDVPVRWIQFDTNVFGDNTKYHDHFESIGRYNETFIDALYYNKIPVENLSNQIQHYNVKIDLDRLWESSIFHNGELSKYTRYTLMSEVENTCKNPADYDTSTSLLQLAIQDITGLIPAGDTFILVDGDQWGTGGTVEGRRAIPFLERNGEYWGPPPDDETAIRELERLRLEGARFMVFVSPAFWWLEYYTGLHRHLCEKFLCILENDRVVVFYRWH